MTEANYQLAIERIAEINPGHPLLPTLRRGYSLLNVRRVTDILLKAQEEPDPEPDIETDEGTWEDTIPDVAITDNDPELRQLFIQKSNLFVKRAKLSNRLHDCRTDKDRSVVVDAIIDAQREIEEHFQKMRHYRKTGVLISEDEQYHIPTDGAELIRLLNSLRVMASRKKKEIEALYHLDRKPETMKKLDKNSQKLNHYELYIKHVQNEIERRKPGGVLE